MKHFIGLLFLLHIMPIMFMLVVAIFGIEIMSLRKAYLIGWIANLFIFLVILFFSIIR